MARISTEAISVGKIGYGYGSEFHLLRYLGRHRHCLNRRIEEKSGGKVRDWLDFAFAGDGGDTEWKGVDFLEAGSAMISAWKRFWPQTGNVPNWDAVGLLDSDSGT